MTVIETKSRYGIGDKTITTFVHKNFSVYFEIGTEVTIVGIGKRGYDIQDNKGNIIVACGWVI